MKKLRRILLNETQTPAGNLAKTGAETAQDEAKIWVDADGRRHGRQPADGEGDEMTPLNSPTDSAGRELAPVILLGASVRVKDGASAWMRQHGFWLKDWPDSIDGMDFVVVADYTHLGGDSSHWWLENESVKDCGVHPQWLAPNDQAERPTPRRLAPPTGSAPNK